MIIQITKSSDLGDTVHGCLGSLDLGLGLTK